MPETSIREMQIAKDQTHHLVRETLFGAPATRSVERAQMRVDAPVWKIRWGRWLVGCAGWQPVMMTNAQSLTLCQPAQLGALHWLGNLRRWCTGPHLGAPRSALREYSSCGCRAAVQVFNKQITLFREAMYILFGYRVEMATDPTAR